MVKVVRPDWVVHPDEKERVQTIYTLSVHPDGSRVATGSLDTKIRIWNTVPITDELRENDASCHRCLATLTSHSGSVNHLRWSHNGTYLASASDDQVVMVWTKQAGAGGKAFGSTEENHENWFALQRLVGHGADVSAVAWSEDDSYLASVAIDGSVIVWNGFSFEIVARLAAHADFAKGVIWDPVGQFLATQADDNSMRIWRTDDWQLQAEIRDPFVDCPKPNLLRPTWSPEGVHVVAPNAMNGPIFVAAVIDRGTWSSTTSLVGHNDVAEVAAFNPVLFVRDPKQPAVGANLCTVLALCSRSNLSVWSTSRNSPVVIFKEVFDRDILDLSWSKDGTQLWCCSSEGHVALFEFDLAELGNAAPAGALEAHRKTYNFTPRQPISAPTALLGSQQQQRLGTASNPNVLQVRKGPNAKRRVVISSTAAPAPAPTTVVTSSALFQPPLQDSLPARVSTFMSSGGAEATVGFGTTAPVRTNGQVAPVASASGTTWGQGVQGHPMTSTPSAAAATVAGRKRKASNMIADDHYYDEGEDVDPFERSSVYPNRIKGRALGEGRPRADMEIRTLKPAYVRDVDFRITNERERTAEPALAVPAVKTFGSVRVVDDSAGEPKDVFEYRNLTDGPLDGTAEVRVVSGSKTIWYDFVPKHVVVAAGSPELCAVSLEDSTLRTWSASSGRSALPVLVLDSQCAFLTAEGPYLMAITALGTLNVWHVAQARLHIGPIRINELLLSSMSTDNTSNKHKRKPVITTSALVAHGTPLIALDSGTTHTYSAALGAWTRVSEPWWARHSDQWEARRGKATSTVGRGVVRNIEYAINDIIVDAAAAAAGPSTSTSSSIMDTTADNNDDRTTAAEAPGGEQKKAVVEGEKQEATHDDEHEMRVAVTLGHLEARMRAAVAFDSPGEYKTFLLAYAKLVSDEGIRNKGEELVRELLGPIYYQPPVQQQQQQQQKKKTANNEWESTVVGLNKRDLLRDVLKEFTRGRILAGLAQEYIDLLKKISAAQVF